MRELVEGRRPWPLFLHGLAGRGKTCAALCLLDYAGGIYWSLGDLIEFLLLSYKGQAFWTGGHKATTEGIWGQLKRTSLVVVDEIGGRDQIKDHHYETLKRLLDLRQFSPHVVLSNHGLAKIEELYDDRIASRLAAGTVVEMGGPDRRQHNTGVNTDGRQ